MAAVRCISSLLLRNCLKTNVQNSVQIIPRHAALVSQRSYAIYPPDKYAPAIVNIEKLDDIVKSEEQLQSVKYSAIHPTPAYESLGLFQHPTVLQFQNYCLRSGKRAVARSIVEKTFYILKKTQLAAYYDAETEDERKDIVLDPLHILLTAIENCRPQLNLVDVTRGGIEYKVPVPATEARSYCMSMKWLVMAGRDRPHKKVHFPENLAKELIDAHQYKGRVIQKKIDLHKECEANRAYAHYRWQKK